MARDPWPANPWPFAKKIGKTARENSGRRARPNARNHRKPWRRRYWWWSEAVTAALDA
jgi:hypothetical protein